MAGQMRLPKDEDLDSFLKSHPHVKVRLVRPMARAPEEVGGRKRAPAPPAKEKAPRKRSAIEQSMSDQIKGAGLPVPIEAPSQYRPIPDRKYEVDFCWPDLRLILEVDGAVHRIKGTFQSSFERDFLLLLHGWRKLPVSGDDVRGGAALYRLKEIMGVLNAKA